MENQEWRCPDHSKHCQAFEYTDKSIDEIKESLGDCFIAVRDARGSLKIDLEKLESDMKKYYVSKEEIKTIYLLLVAIAMDAIRRMFV